MLFDVAINIISLKCRRLASKNFQINIYLMIKKGATIRFFVRTLVGIKLSYSEFGLHLLLQFIDKPLIIPFLLFNITCKSHEVEITKIILVHRIKSTVLSKIQHCDYRMKPILAADWSRYGHLVDDKLVRDREQLPQKRYNIRKVEMSFQFGTLSFSQC